MPAVVVEESTASTWWRARGDRPPQAAAAKPSNLNLPNVLTTLRIVLVPFFGVALLMDGGDSIAWR